MERWAIATGLASNPLIWNGGTLPLPTSDVYANGFTVTIDTDTTLVAIHTDAGVTAVAGGGFILGDGVTLTANIITGTTDCITHTTTAEIKVVGNVTGSSTTGNVYAIANNGDGAVTVTGNVASGSVSLARGINNNAGGTIHINGNAVGDVSVGIVNNATGVVVITGDAIGGNVSGAGGVQDGSASTGRVFVLGTAIGGPNLAPGVVGMGLNPVQVYRAKVGPNGAAAVTGKVVFFNPGATTYEIKDSTLTSKVLKRSVTGTTTAPLMIGIRMSDALLNSTSKFKIYMSDSLVPAAGKTGLTLFTVLLVKAGQAEAAVTPTIQEKGHGWYEVTPTAAMRNTLGESAWTFIAVGALDSPRLETVIAADSQLVAWGANTIIPATPANLAPLAKTTDLAPLAKTADLVPLAKTADLVPLAKTADLVPLAKTTDLAPLAKTTDLAPLAKTTDLAPLAKTTDLAPLAKTTDLAGLATASQVNALLLNTRANISVPVEIEIPDAAPQLYRIMLALFDEQGQMEVPDSTPTIVLKNVLGVDRSSRLSAPTNPTAGFYYWDYTASSGDAEEQLVWQFNVIEGAQTRIYPATSYVVEFSAYRFSSADRAALNATATKVQADHIIVVTEATSLVVDEISNVVHDTDSRIPDALENGRMKAVTEGGSGGGSGGGSEGGSIPSPIVERSTADTHAITFAWPVSGATITGKASKNNAAYAPVAGVIAYLRAEGEKHYYTLAYAPADRLAAEGVVRYKFDDGTYTRYVTVRIAADAVVDPVETAVSMLLLDWTTIVNPVPARCALNAFRHIRNRWEIVGTEKTVYREDNTTPAYTSEITGGPGGEITADYPDT